MDDQREALPAPVLRMAQWCAAILLGAAVVALGLWVCVGLRAAVVPVLLALLGAALLGPLARQLVARGLPRAAAAALTCVVLIAVVVFAGWVMVHTLVTNAAQLSASLEEAGQRLADDLGSAGDTMNSAAQGLNSLGAQLGGAVAKGFVSGLGVAAQLLMGLVLMLAMLFFLLRDGDRLPGAVRTALPGPVAERLLWVGRRAFAAMSGYMRGTTIIAAIDAAFILIGLAALRVPGAPGLAVLVFVGAYVPYVGAFLSGTVAVLVAFADQGLGTALWTLGVILAVQTIEGAVLQPVVQSRTVRLHPAAVMLAVTAGAAAGGLLGTLMAVPVAAAAFGVLSELRDERRAEPPEPPGPPEAAVAEE
ncbi:AI-2E family transporter [Streptomyces sp. SID13588]|uniref:AI-2E family transporter n=1 Tax=Streptomyces sp. SID13588 TaxID=2706051 RepID=UPI0013C5D685|nr:AI-2E family transporter [Streptomyces sp. SID13588]NEA74163.1 AI-2E family transporter [Streptomyces sp. SID13588]